MIHAVLKSSAADFRVVEQLDISLHEAGEHLFLSLRKTGLNTQEVVDWLQRRYGVSSADVGVSGLKDKQAVTDQWFSIRTPQSAEAAGFARLESIATDDPILAGLTLLAACRHGRKLRRGTHRSNRFEITLRDVQPVLAAGAVQQQVNQRLQCIAVHGFPNYFGTQRFGVKGDNVLRALRHFAMPRKRITRHKRSIYLSAARAALFNTVCAARVTSENWQSLLPGEPVMLAGSRSFFIPAADNPDRDLEERCRLMDVHPSGPLWGRGKSVTSDDCEALELAALSEFSELRAGLEAAGLEQQRRALRAQASKLVWDWLTEDTLRIQVELEKGVYATSLLAELMQWTPMQVNSG